MTFSEHLLALRKRHGLTQREAAEGAGLSLRAYQNYERARRTPALPALLALADFYDLSLDDLVGRER